MNRHSPSISFHQGCQRSGSDCACGSSNSSFLHVGDQSCRQDPRWALVAALYGDGNTLSLTPLATLVPAWAEASLTLFKDWAVQAAPRVSFSLNWLFHPDPIIRDLKINQHVEMPSKSFFFFFSMFTSFSNQTSFSYRYVTADPWFVTVSDTNVSHWSSQERHCTHRRMTSLLTSKSISGKESRLSHVTGIFQWQNTWEHAAWKCKYKPEKYDELIYLLDWKLVKRS